MTSIGGSVPPMVPGGPSPSGMPTPPGASPMHPGGTVKGAPIIGSGNVPPGLQGKIPPTAQEFGAIYKPPSGTTPEESAEYFKAYQTMAPYGNWNAWPPSGMSLTDVQNMVTNLPQTLQKYESMPPEFQYPQMPLQPGEWVGNLAQFYDGFMRSIVQTCMNQIKALGSTGPSTGWT